MRVTHHGERVTISCTEHEFEILGIAIDQVEAGDPLDHLTTSGLRRSWSRRTAGGGFLRIDKDKRT